MKTLTDFINESIINEAVWKSTHGSFVQKALDEIVKIWKMDLEECKHALNLFDEKYASSHTYKYKGAEKTKVDGVAVQYSKDKNILYLATDAGWVQYKYDIKDHDWDATGLVIDFGEKVPNSLV